jgi:hypothetical protein
MEYLSLWDQRNRRFVKNGYRAADVTVEFKRTKTIKIADHSLAQISFNSKLERNDERNRVIDRDIKLLSTTGFRYETIGNVFSPEPMELPDNENKEYEILAHGTPLEGDLSGGRENCFVEGLSCQSGQGTSAACNPGKCLIGKINKVSGYKWKYTSAATFGSSDTPVSYYLGGKEVLELKTIIRGKFKEIGGTELNINKSASKSTLIYLPPANYLDRIFKDNYFKVFNYTMELDGNDPLNGIIASEEEFVSNVLTSAYEKNPRLYKGSTLASLADFNVEEIIKDVINDILFSLDKVWKEKIKAVMDDRWDDRFANHDTNRTFITFVFRTVKELFKKCLQVTKSNLKHGSVKQISDENVRPTYLRLPGASLSYRPAEEETLVIGEDADRFKIPISSLDIGTIVVLSDRSKAYQFLPRSIYGKDLRVAYGMSPMYSSRTKEELYSAKDKLSWKMLSDDKIPSPPVAKWMLAGVDEFLREKKHDIESFYYSYLDPTECSVKNLDWLAQHVGLTEPFWNVKWDQKYKRALIKNALGWFEESLTQTVGGTEYETTKGEVLLEYPFTEDLWRTAHGTLTDGVDFSEIDLSKIPKILYSSYDKSISNESYVTKNNGSKADEFSVYKQDWKGLIESKGSVMSLLFLFSLFQVKAHTANELSFEQIRKKAEVDVVFSIPSDASSGVTIPSDTVLVTDVSLSQYDNALQFKVVDNVVLTPETRAVKVKAIATDIGEEYNVIEDSLVFQTPISGVIITNKDGRKGENIGGILKVKSGLRGQENNAPVLLPTKYTLPQVGTVADKAIQAYENQMIAGVTSITTPEEANNIFFRLPFYYNRDGTTWSLVESIAKYWLSGSLNARPQYAFLAADLWQQGDAFFEPEIIDESIDTTTQIFTLDANFHLEAEDSTDILYN